MDLQTKQNLVERINEPTSFQQAYSDLQEHLRNNRTIADFHFGYKLISGFQSDRRRLAFRKELKVALLTSYTGEFAIPLLQADLMLEDLGCEIYRPHYNQVRQDILDRGSRLYAFRPDVTIVAFQLEDIFQDLMANFAGLTPSEKDKFKCEVLTLYESLAGAFHENMTASSPAVLFLQNQGYPFHAFAPLAANAESLNAFIRSVNGDLERICRKYPNTYVLDYAKLMDEHGIQYWTDPRLYYTARIPVSQRNWLHLSDAYVRHIKAALNIDLKCIVLDLDNTLWGGILGEDGIDNIHLGDTYPGSVFRKFQQYLLSLQSNGYILTVASKNNWEDVQEVLERHRSMVLKHNHFAGLKVNWREKADNIKDLSEEIGVSIDHMLFVDDSPVEIRKVKSMLPAITCLELQTPPLHFTEQFGRLRCFERVAVTGEDKQRGEWYFHDRLRRELRQKASSLDEFYRSLGQQLAIYVNSRKHLPRIVQLSQRTNQFNMTTTRLTERCVEELFSRPDYLLITAALTDRFGENGVVAYAQIRKRNRVWHIDNFLMSCRVLGRTLEDNLLNHVIRLAKREGIESIEAKFIKTMKNAPFSEFYPRNGFRAEAGAGDSVCMSYVLNVVSHIPRNPTLEVVSDERQQPA